MNKNWQAFKIDVKDATETLWPFPPIWVICVLCDLEKRFDFPWQLTILVFPIVLALAFIAIAFVPIVWTGAILWFLYSIPKALYRWIKDLKAGNINPYNNKSTDLDF